MRRIALIALSAALGLALMADAALAVFDGVSFAPLRAELDHRVESDYLSSPLTKSAKKELKAVQKSIKLLDKTSNSIAKDASTTKKVAKLLSKAFKAEFAPVQPAKLAALPPLLEQAAEGLSTTVRAEAQIITDSTDGLDEKVVRKIDKLLQKANDALDAASTATSLKRGLAKIGSAGKSAAKARKLFDKATGGGGGTTATVDGSPWSSNSAQSEYYEGDKTLQIYASRTLGDGTIENIYLLVRGVTGPGTYPLSAANARGNFQVITSPGPQLTRYDLIPDTGVVTVEILDLLTPRIKATFSYQAVNDPAGAKDIAEGSHDVSADVFIMPGNGFDN